MNYSINNRFFAKQLVLDLFELVRQVFNSFVLVTISVFQFFDSGFEMFVFCLQYGDSFFGQVIQLFQVSALYQSMFDFFVSELIHLYILPRLGLTELVVSGGRCGELHKFTNHIKCFVVYISTEMWGFVLDSGIGWYIMVCKWEKVGNVFTSKYYAYRRIHTFH